MHGIFNRTNEPKLEVAKPTEKAKNKANRTENSNNGFSPIKLKKPKTFSFNNKNTVKSKM